MRKDENKKVFDFEELKKEGRKKKSKKKGTLRITLLLVAVAVLVLMLTPVFTVQKIEVEGNSRVTDEQILQISGIKKGDNLFRINIKKTKDKIRTNNYINEVRILRKLPDGVTIKVTERTEVASIKNKAGYLDVDRYGKILKFSDKAGYPVMENINADLLKPGDFLNEEQIKQVQRAEGIKSILDELEMQDRLTEFGIDKNGKVKILIDGNKKVTLGDEAKIDYKLRLLKSVIEELSPTQSGTIDLSKEGQALFSQ